MAFDTRRVKWSGDILSRDIERAIEEIVRRLRVQPDLVPENVRLVLKMGGFRSGSRPRPAAVALLVLGTVYALDSREDLLDYLEERLWGLFRSGALVEGGLAVSVEAAGKWFVQQDQDVVIKFIQGTLVCFPWCTEDRWCSVYVGNDGKVEVREIRLPVLKYICDEAAEMFGWLESDE